MILQTKAMIMRITIEISDSDAEKIRKWCSVSRSLNLASKSNDLLQILLSDLGTNEDPLTVSEILEEAGVDASVAEGDTFIVDDELTELQTFLDRLHQNVRDKIWQLDMIANNDEVSTGKLPANNWCWITILDVQDTAKSSRRIGIGIGRYPGTADVDTIVMWDRKSGTWSRKPSDVYDYSLRPLHGCISVPPELIALIEKPEKIASKNSSQNRNLENG